MSTYYKTINGKRYDRTMLELADKSISKKKDKKISLVEAKKIINVAVDAGKITDIEAETLNYIHDNYTFTASAADYFRNFIFDMDAERKESITQGIVRDDVFGVKEYIMKYYPAIIIGILVLIFFLLNIDRLNLSCDRSDKQRSASTFTETKGDEKQPSAPVSENYKIPAKLSVNNTNEYIVMEKDTLSGISKKLFGSSQKWKEIYDKNRDIIKDPSIIYPGQKLKTDK